MKVRTLIIDDEPIALEKLISYVGRVPFLELVASCNSASEALAVMAAEEIDVVFTDISMPDLDGMEFVESLAKAPMVVFITAYAQYAVDSYRLNAIDYLLKPYSFADFQRAANKVLERYRTSGRENTPSEPETKAQSDSIFIKVDYRFVRVSLSDIRYIKGYGEYLQIYVTGSPTPLLTLSSFASLKERLSPDFLQIHRSYVVNVNRVLRIEKSRVVMDADTFIPIGDNYRPTFMQYVAAHSIGLK